MRNEIILTINLKIVLKFSSAHKNYASLFNENEKHLAESEEQKYCGGKRQVENRVHSWQPGKVL